MLSQGHVPCRVNKENNICAKRLHEKIRKSCEVHSILNSIQLAPLFLTLAAGALVYNVHVSLSDMISFDDLLMLSVQLD